MIQESVAGKNSLTHDYEKEAVMAGLMKSLFVPSKEPKKPKLAPAAGAEKQAETQKSRQGRGLASTDLSGMRQMGAYNGGKSTLGAG